MSKEVDLSILPHLKKFIYKFYDLPEGLPVEVNLKNGMGIAMKHVLREKKKLHKSYNERLSDSITFVISSDLAHLSLTPAFLLNFNLHFDRIFKEHLRQWVIAQWELGISNRQAIKNFLNCYKIKESEYSYDNAQRDWLRFKNKEYDSTKNTSVFSS